MVVAGYQPGHYEAREQALAGTSEGTLLEDYIRRLAVERFDHPHRKVHVRPALREGIDPFSVSENHGSFG
jgi:hypothetical protein